MTRRHFACARQRLATARSLRTMKRYGHEKRLKKSTGASFQSLLVCVSFHGPARQRLATSPARGERDGRGPDHGAGSRFRLQVFHCAQGLPQGCARGLPQGSSTRVFDRVFQQPTPSPRGSVRALFESPRRLSSHGGRLSVSPARGSISPQWGSALGFSARGSISPQWGSALGFSAWGLNPHLFVRPRLERRPRRGALPCAHRAAPRGAARCDLICKYTDPRCYVSDMPRRHLQSASGPHIHRWQRQRQRRQRRQ